MRLKNIYITIIILLSYFKHKFKTAYLIIEKKFLIPPSDVLVTINMKNRQLLLRVKKIDHFQKSRKCLFYLGKIIQCNENYTAFTVKIWNYLAHQEVNTALQKQDI